MAERLQLRRDTAAQWESVNPILRLCEIGLVVDLAGHVTGMKIGDGRVWNALPLIPIAEKVGTSMIADGAVTSEKIAEGVIPTKVSELTNDANYAKTSDVPTKVSQLTNDAQYAKTSAIPTKVSQLTNDRDFATRSEMYDSIGRMTPTKISQLTNDTILQVHHGELDIVNKVYTVNDLSSPIGWTTINRGYGLPESFPISMLDNENIAVYDHDVYYIIDRASLEVVEEQPNYSDVYATKQYVKSLEDRIAALES